MSAFGMATLRNEAYLAGLERRPTHPVVVSLALVLFAPALCATFISMGRALAEGNTDGAILPAIGVLFLGLFVFLLVRDLVAGLKPGRASDE